ncbi:HD-GYP domain-containing protein [Megalodesulfovibrio paquesii]
MPSSSLRLASSLRALVADPAMARRLRMLAGGEPLSVHVFPDDAEPVLSEDRESSRIAFPIHLGAGEVGTVLNEAGPIVGEVRLGPARDGAARSTEGAQAVAELLGVLAGLLAGQESLRQELHAVHEEVDRFCELAARAAGGRSPAEVCKIVVDEARRLFRAGDVCVSLRLSEGEMESAGAECLGPGRAVAGRSDADAAALTFAGEPGERTLSTMMSELMNIQGKVIGVINVASPTPGVFGRADMQLLKALAAQAAAPIESARHQHRLKHILDTTERLNRFEDLDAILDAVLHESRQLVQADAGTIFLVEDGRLRFSYVHNDTLFRQHEANAEIYRSYSLPIDETSIVGYAARTGKTLVIDDAYAIPAGMPYAFNRSFDEQHGYRTRSILSIPLHTHHGALVGVMQIINARDLRGEVTAFPRDLLAYMPLYASHAAAALERAVMTRERVLRMMKLAEMRDPHETGPHVQRVGAYSSEIYAQWARNRGVDIHEMHATRDLLRLAAMLHDVGKVGIADAILKKPGKLTPEEFDIMKWHPVHGALLFHGAAPALDRMCLDICLGHHERWDGSGYPGRIPDLTAASLTLGQGLRGEEIPLAARIVALADVFDALSSRRCYKEPWPRAQVLETITDERGRQFDPELVDAFFQILPLLEAIQERYRDEDRAG